MLLQIGRFAGFCVFLWQKILLVAEEKTQIRQAKIKKRH